MKRQASALRPGISLPEHTCNNGKGVVYRRVRFAFAVLFY